MSDNELPKKHNLPTFPLDEIAFSEYSTGMSRTQTARRTYPNLSTYLRDTGKTQAQLALDLGRSQGYISKLVRGLLQPSLDEALSISAQLGIPVESLVSRERNILVEKS